MRSSSTWNRLIARLPSAMTGLPVSLTRRDGTIRTSSPSPVRRSMKALTSSARKRRTASNMPRL
jgi:hypothetical protein